MREITTFWDAVEEVTEQGPTAATMVELHSAAYEIAQAAQSNGEIARIMREAIAPAQEIVSDNREDWW
jgi:uncharacterized protein with PhoU and TrkA domain